MLKQHDELLAELKEQLHVAQNRMKVSANQHRREIEFHVREKIYLKLHPCRQKSLARRKNEKLSLHYFGPHPIMKRIRKVAYQLDLPTSAAIHPIFHMSQLKQVIGDLSICQPLP